MSLKCGVVGLPNVGKSTLFNALSNGKAHTANYAFCTIEPNNAIVEVPDERLQKLAHIAGSVNVIPALIEFVDIAGIVEGASKGEGLGNKFLANIREVDAIVHVVRCFKDEDITHIHNKVDPLFDSEIVNTELILADIDSIDSRLVKLKKKAKTDKELYKQVDLLEKCRGYLSNGNSLRGYSEIDVKDNLFNGLLTIKPMLYICNVLESDLPLGGEIARNFIKNIKNTEVAVISSKIESEIASLESPEEKREFLESLGLKETGLERVITLAYKLLGLESFFTVGPKEAHAWHFKSGSYANNAAGIIHSDFEKGFIKAEITSYEDFILCGSEAEVRAQGKMRIEGKDYRVQDGDVVHFRFNV